MNATENSIRMKPQLMSRDLVDFCIVWFIAFPILLLELIGAPGLIAFLVTGSWNVTALVAIGIYLAFQGFAVSAITLSPEGIRFHRLLGSPEFLSWSTVQSVEIAPRWELITKGWLWPVLPCREMTASFTSLGHYRISWSGGYCYYPPADAAAFESYVSAYLQPPTA